MHLQNKRLKQQRILKTKKLIRPPDRQACSGGLHAINSLFLIEAKITDHYIHFLVDTGSSYSILPTTYSPDTHTSSFLLAANGTNVQITGTKTLTFHIKNFDKPFTRQFRIANTIYPILGSDFFSDESLLIDVRNQRIYQLNDLNTKTITPSHTSKPSINQIIDANNIHSMIPKMFPGTIVKSPLQSTNQNIKHYIPTTNCTPQRNRSRPLPPHKHTAVQKEFSDLEDAGIIRRSSSEWASPIHVVTKKDGSFRPCGDYRQLNSHTIHDSYPMPRITDILHRFAGTIIFSTLDLSKAYHQIPVNVEDIPKTAVITPFGLYEYLFMPFGLRNGAQTLQCFADQIFRDTPFAFAYLDDIIIASKDSESHSTHLHTLYPKR